MTSHDHSSGSGTSGEEPGTAAPSKLEWGVLLVLVLLGLGARLWVLGQFSDLELVGDQNRYLEDAERLLAGEEMVAKRGPGYPAFVAASQVALGGDLAGARRGNALLGMLMVIGTWVLGRRIFSVRVGLIAAGIVALLPRNLPFPLYLFSENLYAVCACLGVALALIAAQRGKLALALLAGALLGLGVLTREMMLYFVPLVAVALCWCFSWREKRTLLAAGAVLGGAFAVIAPWSVRNAFVHEQFVLVGFSDGRPLYLGNHEGDAEQETARALYRKTGSFIETNAGMREIGMQAIRDRQPTWFFEKVAETVPLLLRPNEKGNVVWGWSARAANHDWADARLRWLLLPSQAALLLLASVGVAHFRWRRPDVLPLLFGAFTFLAHTVANANPFRFQYPLGWVFALAAAVAIERGLPKTAGRRWVAALILAVVLVSQWAVLETWTAPFGG